MIRASATYYALLVCLIFGALCTSIVMISGLNHSFRKHQTLKSNLSLTSENGIQYGLAEFDAIDPIYQKFEYQKQSFQLKRLSWGFFDLLFSKQEQYGTKIERIGLLGFLKTDTTTALYLSNKNSALKLCGKTKINGNCYLPKKGVERGHLTGHFFEGKKLIYGNQSLAEKHLPSLNPVIEERISSLLNKEFEELSLESLQQKEAQIFSFAENTRILKGRRIAIQNLDLRGNLIIHAEDSIYLDGNSNLNNVILIAPKVFIDEGFEGSLQVISNKKIVIAKEAKLKYPSLIILKEQSSEDQIHRIEIQEGAIIAGGVLAFSKQPDFRKQVKIEVAKDAKIVGDLISYGQVELKGDLLGSLYANELSLNNGASNHLNYLLDASINPRGLPEDFSTISWFKDGSNKKMLISWLE